MVTHSSILAWRIPSSEEAGGPQSMASQRAGHNWATDTQDSGSKRGLSPTRFSPPQAIFHQLTKARNKDSTRGSWRRPQRQCMEGDPARSPLQEDSRPSCWGFRLARASGYTLPPLSRLTFRQNLEFLRIFSALTVDAWEIPPLKQNQRTMRKTQ